MVDSQFRHPKLVLLLVLAVTVLALVLVAGPRDGGIAGVGDASASDDEVTTTTDPDHDDGVVFTVPASELGEVIEAPSDVVVGGAGTTPDPAVVAPSTTSRPASTPQDSVPEASTSPTTELTQADETSTDGSTEDAEATGVDEVDVDEADVVASAEFVPFDEVPEMVGFISGSPSPGPVVLGQVGGRDSASVPWMLLIGANFLVAGGALVALRLRR